jgi:putative ABC transport system permease protein
MTALIVAAVILGVAVAVAVVFWLIPRLIRAVYTGWRRAVPMNTLRLLVCNLFKHPVRTTLTMASAFVAVLLLVMLRSVVTTLDLAVKAATTSRIVTQSAVSLFVDLPSAYKAKIENVDGVQSVSRWNWFGGVYQDPANFFAQFALDAESTLNDYPEIKLGAEERAKFLAERRGCIIGRQLAKNYGWKVGDTVPLTGTIYAKPSAWEFRVSGIYESTGNTVDENTMFFHYEYLDETRRSGECEGPPGTGIFIIKVAPGRDLGQVSEAVDAIFAGGPQRTRTQTEAAFNQGFVSMLGNLPRFLFIVGMAVVFAVTLTVVNTMLIASRERTRDVGVLKALGFPSRTPSILYFVESIALAGVGGGLAILVAVSMTPQLRDTVAKFNAQFAMFQILPDTVVMAATLTTAIGLLGGLVPAINAARLKAVDALRMEI